MTRRTGPSDEQRQVVVDRAGGRCERCREPGCVLHHRRPRGLGGSRVAWINDPSNLVLLCSACHVHIESHRAEAYAAGLLVHYANEPWAVPAVLAVGRVWLGPTYQTNERSTA